MKRVKVGEEHVASLWGSIGHEFLLEEERIGRVNLNHEGSVEFLVEEVLRPYLERCSVSWQVRTKASLQFAILGWSQKRLRRFYDREAFPMYMPDHCYFSAKD